MATCGTGFDYNSSTQLCQNTTLITDTTAPVNTEWVNTNYLTTQLGSTGLAGWTPAIIALSVGMLFLGVFLNKSGRSI
jgi:hypothetical protein